MRAAHETHDTLRVLHVLGELRASGAETMLKGSLPVMAAAGVEVSVVSTGKDVGEFGSVLQDLGVQVHHLPFRARPMFLLQLVKLARKHDVVHLHTERASFWLGASVRAASVPVIRTVHNTFLFTGKLKMVRGTQRRVLRRLGVTFVAIGRDVADNERDRFGVPTVLVPNWAESRFFDNRERSPDARHPLIVSVGNC
ncbi:MAG: hypothetical protein QOE76_3268, partial [Frankiales bacterium]|nr:hypothetical protein [Frankiales bacterium]